MATECGTLYQKRRPPKAFGVAAALQDASDKRMMRVEVALGAHFQTGGGTPAPHRKMREIFTQARFPPNFNNFLIKSSNNAVSPWECFFENGKLPDQREAPCTMR
jgi:hypothetical protein